MISLWRYLAPLFFSLIATHASAEWPQEKIEGATRYLSQIRQDWTVEDTKQLLVGALDKDGVSLVNYGIASGKGPTSTVATIIGDDKKAVGVMITGESMLVNGHDVTGNLGNKVTYGANSPIIEGAQNSQIAAGSQSSVTKDSTTSYSLNISLSLALSVSVATNLYLLWRARRQSNTRKAGAPRTPAKPGPST